VHDRASIHTDARAGVGQTLTYSDDERTRPTGQMAIVANLSKDDEGATSHIEMRRALIGHYAHRQVP
jgi:hypothetical protein